MDFQRKATKEALLRFANSFLQLHQQRITHLESFSTGCMFADMLNTVANFQIDLVDVNRNPEKWTQRLSNLSRILQKIDIYMSEECQKNIEADDISLFEIAKNNSIEHIVKFFELIIAVFMESPQKEEYVQSIMNLDESSQHSLVIIVQNAIEERIKERRFSEKMQDKERKSVLREDNASLLQELIELQRIIEHQRGEIDDLKDTVSNWETEVIELKSKKDLEEESQDIYLEKENNSLKEQILMLIRDHQIQSEEMRQENNTLRNELIALEDSHNRLNHKLNEEDQGERIKELERNQRKLQRTNDDKDRIIDTLKQKLNSMSAKHSEVQQNGLEVRQELVRKQVQIEKLEKSMKIIPESIHPTLSSSTIIQSHDEIVYFQEEIEELRKTVKDLKLENGKLKKRVQSSMEMQTEKKKMEKLVQEMSKFKEGEIEMLLVSLYDLRTENIRIHKLLELQR